MAMNVGQGGTDMRPVINVTPLVDVVLVLLIIFMLITPMLQRGASVQMPQATNVAKKGHPENILLSVDLNKHYWIESKQIQEADLEKEIKAAAQAKPGLPILIKADKRLTCGPVKKAIAAVNKSGLNGASLAAEVPSGTVAPSDSE
jgi:biopolymer transport protein TolR